MAKMSVDIEYNNRKNEDFLWYIQDMDKKQDFHFQKMFDKQEIVNITVL